MTTELETVVMLPPCVVTEEHKALIDNAERAVSDYTEMLADRIKRDILDFKYGHPEAKESLALADREFRNDPMRQEMIRHLSEIRMLVEQPRFLIKAT